MCWCAGQRSNKDLCLLSRPNGGPLYLGALACGDFKIVGVSPSEDLAQCFALQAISEKAVTHGILQLGCDRHILCESD